MCGWYGGVPVPVYNVRVKPVRRATKPQCSAQRLPVLTSVSCRHEDSFGQCGPTARSRMHTQGILLYGFEIGAANELCRGGQVVRP
jgi:hypothetical protein